MYIVVSVLLCTTSMFWAQLSLFLNMHAIAFMYNLFITQCDVAEF
jgi:hypothetical protein